jgi:hypothetical protein
MLLLQTLKYQSRHLSLFILFLLMLGPTQSSWCFQDGNTTIVPSTPVIDCHIAPTDCFTIADILVERGGETTPAGCNNCFDFTFKDFASIIPYNNIRDFTFTLDIAYFQPPSVVSLPPANSLSFFAQTRKPYRKSLNLHKSIQSTILLI